MHSFIKTLVLVQFCVVGGHGQKLCNFSESAKTNVPSFIQNFSTSKCMRVSGFGFKPASKVLIDECSYWNKATTDQKFTLVNSTLNKVLLKTDAGNNDSYCLTTKYDNLLTDTCQSLNFDQNWTFKPVSGKKGWFLIEQYSSKKCLIPKSRATGAGVELLPCNSYQTEQIWKICM
ncbi:uncharacterized protein LOC110863439 [Folsomia candida]|uniref:uncharacterized protein LOC110863439 n=1 Tax=Folsomia candida TaxID=158441 RepID=UPI000B8F84B4|nr:uncharacterized protein LOC110863439 [Folsomia candida]